MRLAMLTIAATITFIALAQAQNCRPGQSVTCERNYGGGYTCRCTY
jgi:hypothetical protein